MACLVSLMFASAILATATPDACLESYLPTAYIEGIEILNKENQLFHQGDVIRQNHILKIQVRHLDALDDVNYEAYKLVINGLAMDCYKPLSVHPNEGLFFFKIHRSCESAAAPGDDDPDIWEIFYHFSLSFSNLDFEFGLESSDGQERIDILDPTEKGKLERQLERDFKLAQRALSDLIPQKATPTAWPAIRNALITSCCQANVDPNRNDFLSNLQQAVTDSMLSTAKARAIRDYFVDSVLTIHTFKQAQACSCPQPKPFNFYLGLGYTLLALAILLLTLILFVYFATDFLREKSDGRYSLSKTQIYVWTFVIFNGMVFLFLVNGDLPGMNQSILFLLGLSALTRFLGGQIPTAPPKTTKEKKGEISGKTAPSKRDNKFKFNSFFDFIRQILRDSPDSPLSVGRLQNLIFNFLLLLYFIQFCVTELKLPEIDTMYLALIGISDGIYVGLKYMDTKPPED
jgi:hypothetical protein